MSAPFSNSTEGEAWMENWCYRCQVDAPFRNGISPTGCPLILTALCGETPAEWIRQDGDRLGDRYHCINYRGPGWRNPEPRPIPPPPGQDGLFPAEEHRGTRMLTRAPDRQEVTA